MNRWPIMAVAISTLVHGCLVALLVFAATRPPELPALFIDVTKSSPTVGEGEGPRAPKAVHAPRVASAHHHAPPASAPHRSAPQPRETAAASRETEPATATPTPATATPTPAIATPTPPIAGETSPPGESVPREADSATVPAESSVTTGTQTATAPTPATPTQPSQGGGSGGTAGGVADSGQGAAVAADGGGGVNARPGQGLALATGGGGGATVAEYSDYIARLRERIQTTLRYPLAARRRGLTGTVELQLTVQPDGAIRGISVVGSSSHPSLDDAALEAVRNLRPTPFPTGITPRQLRLRLPVVFELR